MIQRRTIAIATTNRGKLAEVKSLLRDLPYDPISLDALVPRPGPVVEDGDTFAANAIKKATAIARATNLLTLADDSGLAVDALDGRPGVRSARFAHERATDAENNSALIEALERAADHDVREPFRARFVCALALVDPFDRGGPPFTVPPFVVEGTCEGRVVRAPRGAHGFGYDPLFVVDGLEKTMAELTNDEKNERSHRARAFALLRPRLLEIAAAADALIAAIFR